jgi:hypothetical protein
MNWLPISSAKVDGTVSRIRYKDALGHYAVPFDCFLHDDGCWYRIEPPMQLSGKPTHWIPSVDFLD